MAPKNIHIELEVTLRCNTKCPHCDRHCDILSQPDTDMSIDQINRFCEEVIKRGHVGLVSVLGGEPSLHPDIEYILMRLAVLKDYGYIATLIYATNGILPLPVNVTEDFTVYNSPVRYKHHHRMDISPTEEGVIYASPCPIAEGCGIALNCFGYWPCGAGGAICRLLDIPDMVRYSLSTASDWDYDTMCRHCAHGAATQHPTTDFSTPASPVFTTALQNWQGYKGRRY